MIAIDMEMPKSCAVCPMNDDNCWCAITVTDMRADYDKTRLDDCPLIDLTISALKKQEQSCDTCKHGRFGSEACINCRVGFPNHYEAEAEEDND